MKSIEEMKAQQARELAVLERQHAIADALPLVPNHVITVAGCPLATYKTDLRGAIEMLYSFRVVPMYVVVDTFRYIAPVQTMKPCVADKANGAPYAVRLDVEGGATHEAHATLDFYTRVDRLGYIHVKIDIEGPDYIGAFKALAPESNHEISPKGRSVRRYRWKYNNTLHGLFDHTCGWSTGSDSYRHTYLLVCDQDREMAGHELTHALGQLHNLADIVSPNVDGANHD